MNLDINAEALTLGPDGRRVTLDLRAILRARVHDLAAMRDLTVVAFEPRLVQPLADGLRLQLVNEPHGLFIPVEFREEAAGFRVTVKGGWICEQMSINRRLMSLDVLPDLLATRVGDSGFYLLPDYSGTLVRFKEHAPTVNRDRIYMHQREWEKLTMMNCFALKQGRQGTLAVVHKGDFFCQVVTEVNQQGANRLYASFGLRHESAEPIKQEDKELIVRFTEGRE